MHWSCTMARSVPLLLFIVSSPRRSSREILIGNPWQELFGGKAPAGQTLITPTLAPGVVHKASDSLTNGEQDQNHPEEDLEPKRLEPGSTFF